MVQWVKILLAKPENLNSISRTMWGRVSTAVWWKGLHSRVGKGRTNSHKLSSNHHMHTKANACLPPGTT